MAMMPKLTVSVTGDYLAHEIMRFALKEIVRKQQEDPFGFSGVDAVDIAEMCLEKVEEFEDGS